MSAIPPTLPFQTSEWPVLPPSPLEDDVEIPIEKPEPKLNSGGINYVW